MTATPTEDGLAFAVARTITKHGAAPVRFGGDDRNARLEYVFEDPYSIIGIASFPTVYSLVSGWIESQDGLMRVLAQAGAEVGPKAWDTYLVLVVEEPMACAHNTAVAEIRGNTRYARKLVISIEDLVSDPTRSEEFNLARALAPILPLALPANTAYRDPLSTLPGRLKATGVDEEVLEAVITAHRRGFPLIAELHSRLTGEEVSE